MVDEKSDSFGASKKSVREVTKKDVEESDKTEDDAGEVERLPAEEVVVVDVDVAGDNRHFGGLIF